jgi:hypothetical protein
MRPLAQINPELLAYLQKHIPDIVKVHHSYDSSTRRAIDHRVFESCSGDTYLCRLEQVIATFRATWESHRYFLSCMAAIGEIAPRVRDFSGVSE